MVTTESCGIDLASLHAGAARSRRHGTRPWTQGLVARAIKHAAVASACATVALTARAQDVGRLDTPPPLFAAFRTEVLPSDGLAIGGPFLDRLSVTSGGSDYSFTEYLPWQQLRLTFDLRKLVDAEPILRTMRVLSKLIKLTCGQYAVRHYALGPKGTRIMLFQPTDNFMSDVYARLIEERLIGGFECLTSSTDISPRIQVTWETGNRNPAAVIPANEWRFLVEIVGRDRMRAYQMRFEEHRRKVDALRSKPTIGLDVQVMAEDLPSSLLDRFKQPTNQMRMPYAICGLITEVRTPLAQVQVQSDTLMLPIRKLLPIGQQLSADDMSRQLRAQAPTQSACLK